MKKFISLVINNANEMERNILIAFLSEIGFDGFEETHKQLFTSIEKKYFDKEALEKITGRFPAAEVAIAEVEEKNWNQQWESSFEPVMVEDFAAVRALFHNPVTNVQYEIIITPKMSFGTGHHATTYLMMQQMRTLHFKDAAVIDFGTGTAVLAILAEKMGASKIWAIDNDEWAIQNAWDNIQENHCKQIQILQADTIAIPSKAGIILANINLNIIIQNLPAIISACAKNTKILFSGLLTNDLPVLLPALEAAGITVTKTTSKEDWVCLYSYYN